VIYLARDIDYEFEEFVRNNFNKLTDNQKELCKKLGISTQS